MSELIPERLALITQLADLPGPSGEERQVALAIRRILTDLGLAVQTDPLGTLSATIGGRDAEASILLLAHMDEVGLRVRSIQADGTLRFEIYGWIDPAILPGQRISLLGDRGTVDGIIGARSAHLSQVGPGSAGPPPSWIDIGATSTDEVRSMGIDIGTGAVFNAPIHALGDGHITGKALDNRVGCALLLECAARLATARPGVTIHLGFSTQEEVGAHGARVLARRLAPTIGLIIDTVSAADTLTTAPQATVAVGAGPVLRVADVLPRGSGPALTSTTYSRPIRRSLEVVAREAGIPCQRDIATTWTDASGAATAADGLAIQGLYLPRRGSHTPNEVMAIHDIEAAATLVRRWLDAMDGPTVQSMRLPW